MANVSINGQQVGQTSNMFKRYNFDVKANLKVFNSQHICDSQQLT